MSMIKDFLMDKLAEEAIDEEYEKYSCITTKFFEGEHKSCLDLIALEERADYKERDFFEMLEDGLARINFGDLILIGNCQFEDDFGRVWRDFKNTINNFGYYLKPVENLDSSYVYQIINLWEYIQYEWKRLQIEEDPPAGIDTNLICLCTNFNVLPPELSKNNILFLKNRIIIRKNSKNFFINVKLLKSFVSKNKEKLNETLRNYFYDRRLSAEYLFTEEYEIESPIEDIMLKALLFYIPEDKYIIKSQTPVLDGTYRVDFLITSRDNCKRPLIVECDGHDFHEKTKKQAQRDKQRDRDCLLNGYIVMRFTGSEIVRNVIKCVNEIKAYFSV